MRSPLLLVCGTLGDMRLSPAPIFEAPTLRLKINLEMYGSLGRCSQTSSPVAGVRFDTLRSVSALARIRTRNLPDNHVTSCSTALSYESMPQKPSGELHPDHRRCVAPVSPSAGRLQFRPRIGCRLSGCQQKGGRAHWVQNSTGVRCFASRVSLM